MRLASTSWGEGERVAVLLHGMMGSAEQFWRVGPALADRGYRTVAVDLPGHGHSPAAASANLALFAASVAETVGPSPALAIGHSLGGVVLAEALPVLQPAKAVYVDIPLTAAAPEEPEDAGTVAERFERARAGRTVAALALKRPGWSQQDRAAEARAARQFDIATAVAVEVATAMNPPAYPPTADVPSLVIRADPSRYVSPIRAAELQELGFDVCSVRGAGHSIWYGHFTEFMAVLDAWLS